MKYEAGLGLELHWLQQVLISVYEDNCPLEEKCDGSLISVGRIMNRIVGSSTERPNGDIGRRHVRFPKRLGGVSVALYQIYLGLLGCIRLYRGPKTKLGSLVAHDGKCTQYEGGTLHLLLTAHFSGSNVMKKGRESASACRTNRLDWRVAARLLLIRE